MAVNLLIYPLDYSPTIVGPSDLELRLIEVELKIELMALLAVQDRRDAGTDAIDIDLKDPSIGIFHSGVPRFGFRDRNIGSKGLMLGGESNNSLTGRITKFDYLFEASSMIGADIGIARYSGVGTSAVNSGYLLGGDSGASVTAKIERVDFQTELVYLLSQELQTPLSEAAGFATAAQSLVFGGLSALTTTIINQIRSFRHADESTSLLAAQLAVPKSNTTVVGTTRVGYIVGGKTVIGSNAYSQSIELMDLLTQSISLSGLSLSVGGLAFSVGVGNDANGYIVSGRQANANVNTIQKIAYATGILSPLAVSLSPAISDATAVGSSRIGYVLAGGSTPTGEFKTLNPAASVSRLTFVGEENPIEKLEPIAFALPYPVVGASGVSDYSPGVYSGEASTILNLYDDVYAAKNHGHLQYALTDDVYYRGQLRLKLASNLILYVDAANTVPTATGLGTLSNPFQTINAAISSAKQFDYNSHNLTIKVADGLYTESVSFDGIEWVGLKSQGSGAAIILEGNIVTPGSVIIRSTNSTLNWCVRVEKDVDVWVRGIRTSSSYTTVGVGASLAFYVLGGTLTYSDVEFGSGFYHHVLGRGGVVRIAGDCEVLDSCYQHVRVVEGCTWSPRRLDQRYSLFPGAAAIVPSNIKFATGLTMDALFTAETNASIDLQHPTITFTGSAVVTGKKGIVQTGGVFRTYRGLSTEDPLEYALVPGSLPYDGLLGDVNFLQLLNKLSLTSGESRIVIDNNLQILLGNFAIGGSTVPPFVGSFGTIYAPGTWGAGGPLSTEIYFSSIAGVTAFTGQPIVFTSESHMSQKRIARYVDKFVYDIDEVAGYLLGTSTVYVNWIAIGRI